MADRTYILFVYERNISTVELLKAGIPAIVDKEKAEIIFKKNMDVTDKDIDKTDILVLVRPHNYLSQKIAESAKEAGCFIIFFMDDDMFELPENIHSIPWRIKSLKKNLVISDFLMTSNQMILDKYKSFTVNKRGVILETSVSDQKIERIPKKNINEQIVKMVYAAGDHHSDSIRKYVYPILNGIEESLKGRISMTFIGVKSDIDFSNYSFPIEFIDAMPLETYRQWMLEHKYDIGFAPLDDTPFNNKKYYNKFFEYTINGIVGIYSDCAPYTSVIENGYNGFLAKYNEEDWIQKTTRLIEDGKLRQEMLDNAKYVLKSRFSDEVVKKELERSIPEFYEKRYHKKNCKSLLIYKILYRISLAQDTVYLLAFYCRQRGFGGMIKKTAEHFKAVDRMGK